MIENKLGVVTIPFKLYGSKYPGKHLVILDYTFEKIYIGDHKLYSIDQKTEHHLAKFSAKIKKKSSSDELKEAAENDKPDFILLEDLQVKFVSGLLKSTFYKDDHYQAYKLREFNFRNIEFCKHIVIIKADYGMIDNEKSAQIQQLQEFLSKLY